MYSLFTKGNRFDRSPFQYGTIAILESRVLHYQYTYHKLAEARLGRVEGNKSILARILSSINVQFNGNLIEFMSQVHQKGLELSGTIGVTTDVNVGRLHDSMFYPGCKEVIIASRNTRWMWFDLWERWRDIPSVTVIDHPVTDMTYFELGVMNEARLSSSDIVTINVDIATLYTQWYLYKASKSEPTIEMFLSEIIYPNMFKSHIDICLFNRLLMRFGIIEECSVKSNLPFSQIPLNQEMDRILNHVENNFSGRRLFANQFLTSVPAIFEDNYLESIDDPELTPMVQSLWAIYNSKAKRAALVLEMGRRQEWATMTDLIAKLKRTMIEVETEKVFKSRLPKGDSDRLVDRFNTLVKDRLP